MLCEYPAEKKGLRAMEARLKKPEFMSRLVSEQAFLELERRGSHAPSTISRGTQRPQAAYSHYVDGTDHNCLIHIAIIRGPQPTTSSSPIIT